jgi:hypothetical protein
VLCEDLLLPFRRLNINKPAKEKVTDGSHLTPSTAEKYAQKSKKECIKSKIGQKIRIRRSHVPGWSLTIVSQKTIWPGTELAR